MGQTFKGKTGDVQGVFLGAEFWSPGRKVFGKVLRAFETKLPDGGKGRCYTVRLAKPVVIEDHQEQVVAIGALRGFQMALDASGAGELQAGDALVVECTGKAEQGEGKSPMVEFDVEVTRE